MRTIQGRETGDNAVSGRGRGRGRGERRGRKPHGLIVAGAK